MEACVEVCVEVCMEVCGGVWRCGDAGEVKTRVGDWPWLRGRWCPWRRPTRVAQGTEQHRLSCGVWRQPNSPPLPPSPTPPCREPTHLYAFLQSRPAPSAPAAAAAGDAAGRWYESTVPWKKVRKDTRRPLDNTWEGSGDAAFKCRCQVPGPSRVRILRPLRAATPYV